MSKGNESAFPAQEINSSFAGTSLDPGLTKRELFAAMAMQGLICAKRTEDELEIYRRESKEQVGAGIAETARIFADALLAELAKEPAK